MPYTMTNRVLVTSALLVALLSVVSAKRGHPWFYKKCEKFRHHEDTFQCKTNRGWCVGLSSLCNSMVDCLDGSDEDPVYCSEDHRVYCDTGFEDKWIRSQPLEKWQCDDTMCIELCRRCDGQEDCRDGSDEDPARCSDKILRQILAGVDYQCQRDDDGKEL